MHSENIAAYIGLDVHKETLAVAIAAPERLGEVRFYGTSNNEAQAVRRFFQKLGNDSNLLIVFYVQIMPDDFVMQLHRF